MDPENRPESPRTLATRTRVAYQGEPGAFGQLAAERVAPDVESVAVATFDHVVDRVARGDVAFGVVPLHNVIAGAIDGGVAALVRATDAVILRQISVPVHLCVLGLPGATLDDIEELHSHRAALAQCPSFLRAHPRIVPRRARDTAGAARQIARGGDPRRAALASRRAGELYGLAVLADGVEDRPDNATRFAVIARRGWVPA